MMCRIEKNYVMTLAHCKGRSAARQGDLHSLPSTVRAPLASGCSASCLPHLPTGPCQGAGAPRALHNGVAHQWRALAACSRTFTCWRRPAARQGDLRAPPRRVGGRRVGPCCAPSKLRASHTRGVFAVLRRVLWRTGWMACPEGALAAPMAPSHCACDVGLGTARVRTVCCAMAEWCVRSAWRAAGILPPPLSQGHQRANIALAGAASHLRSYRTT